MSSGQANPVLRYIRKLAAVDDARALPDRPLLERFVRQRDETAFAALVDRHGPLVLNLARRLLHNLHDAEDVLQATFLVLARKAGSIRRGEAVGGWLYGVAYRLALKVRARAGKRPMRALPGEVPHSETPDQLTVNELQEALHQELMRLPEKYRAPMLLCYLQEKTRDEAARQLGWTLTAVKKRLERGRDLLRRRLTRRGLTLSLALLTAALANNAVSAALPVHLVAAATQAATAPTALPPSVLTLADGLLQTMFVAKLKIIVTVLLLASGVGVGSSVLVKYLSHAEAGQYAAAPAGELPPSPPAQERPDPEPDTLDLVPDAEADKPAGLPAEVQALVPDLNIAQVTVPKELLRFVANGPKGERVLVTRSRDGTLVELEAGVRVALKLPRAKNAGSGADEGGQSCGEFEVQDVDALRRMITLVRPKKESPLSAEAVDIVVNPRRGRDGRQPEPQQADVVLLNWGDGAKTYLPPADKTDR